MTITALCRLVLVLCGSAILAIAQTQTCQKPQSLDNYIQCRIIANEHHDDRNYLAKQANAPAAALNSMVLADSAASPDLFGASANPAPTASRSLSPNASDFSGTLNLYAVYSAVNGTDPYVPRTYLTTSAWRRVSVTFDHSTAVDSLPTDLPGNSNTYMAKAVLFGFRDFAARREGIAKGAPAGASPQGNTKTDNLARADREYNKLHTAIRDYLFCKYGSAAAFPACNRDDPALAAWENDKLREGAGFWTEWGERLKALDPTIEDLVSLYVRGQDLAAKEPARTLNAMKDKLQVAAAFTSRLSYSHGTNLYRTEAIFDKGFGGGAFNSTVNVSYDFQNSQSKAKNRQVARVVEQLSVPIKGIARWTEEPIVEAFSGEGDFGTNGTPIYRGAFRLVFPARMGLNVPISIQYANRTGAGPKGDIKAQVGLTFDLAKAIPDDWALRSASSKKTF